MGLRGRYSCFVLGWGIFCRYSEKYFLKFFKRRKGILIKVLRFEVDNFRLGMIMERFFKYFFVVIIRY